MSCENKKKSGFQKSHGQSRTKLYKVWNGMKSRCTHPTDTSWRYYGAKGIKVCAEWQTFKPFYEWAKSSGYADHLTIDRLDRSQDYTPDNCRWADPMAQSRNKCNNVWETVFGETKCRADWYADPRCQVTECTVLRRVQMGMSFEEAMTTPPQRSVSKRDKLNQTIKEVVAEQRSKTLTV